MRFPRCAPIQLPVSLLASVPPNRRRPFCRACKTLAGSMQAPAGINCDQEHVDQQEVAMICWQMQAAGTYRWMCACKRVRSFSQSDVPSSHFDPQFFKAQQQERIVRRSKVCSVAGGSLRTHPENARAFWEFRLVRLKTRFPRRLQRKSLSFAHEGTGPLHNSLEISLRSLHNTQSEIDRLRNVLG
jgi:hypothetical protein